MAEDVFLPAMRGFLRAAPEADRAAVWRMTAYAPAEHWSEPHESAATATLEVKAPVGSSERDRLLGDDPLRVAHAGFLGVRGTRRLGTHPIRDSYRDVQVSVDVSLGALRHLGRSLSVAWISPDLRDLVLYCSVTSRWPLYYRRIEDGIVWSTSSADVLATRPALHDVDFEVMPSMILDGRLPADRTSLVTIRRLPPGYCLQLTDSRISIRRVDELRATFRRASVAEASADFTNLLRRSVERLAGTAPTVVTLLSGGVDSAAVAWETRRLRAAALTLTTDALEPMAINYNHAPHVARVAGLLHLKVDTSGLMTDIDAYLRPVIDGAVLTLRSPNRSEFVAAAARVAAELGPAVFMTGLAAESLLAHDDRGVLKSQGVRALNPLENPMLNYPDQTLWQAVGAILRRAPRVNPTTGLPAHWSLDRLNEWLTADALDAAVRLDREEVARCGRELPPDQEAVHRAVYSFLSDDEIAQDFTYVYSPYDCLRLDPFVDRDLIEFCLSLRPKHRVQFVDGYNIDKFLLRHAYSGPLSREVAWATQQVSETLVHLRVAAAGATRLSGVLSTDSLLASRGILDSKLAGPLLRDPTSPRARAHVVYVLRAYAAEMWLRGLATHRFNSAPIRHALGRVETA